MSNVKTVFCVCGTRDGANTAYTTMRQQNEEFVTSPKSVCAGGYVNPNFRYHQDVAMIG